MRLINFSTRVFKEIIRDPLTLVFGLGFPIALLCLMSAIQANIPVSLFEIDSLAPGITVFGLSFFALFSALLIAKDRESALMLRLYTTPLKPIEYIAGYSLPLLAMAILQSVFTYGFAFIFGLKFSGNLIFCLLLELPIALLYIVIGLLFGSILNVKQVGGICGALLTNLSAWISGIWFDINLVGGAFESIAKVLPFYHAVELQRNVLAGEYSFIIINLVWILVYVIVLSVLSIYLFLKQMKKN